MKKIYKYFLVIGLLSIIASCKKSFLEIKPKGRVVATKTSDYDLLLNNLELIVITGADGAVLPGDEITVKDPAWSGASFRDKQLFKWDFNIYTPEDDAPETRIPIKGLYIYNKIISEVMDATEGSEIIKKSIQAEAYAGRAWTYFLLINYYGKPYNPATAATDPGFPLITNADINAGPYERASVQEIYDQIISDLNKAIPSLMNVGVPHRSRMSKAAAQGLLAKVYIFMGKHAEAMPLLNESLANLTQSAPTAPTLLLNYNTAFPGFPTAPNDQENVYAKVMTNGHLSGSQTLVFLTPKTEALYGATDVRRVRWLTNSFTFPNGLKLFRRGSTTVNFWGIRVPELILFRAELKARMNDIPGAVTELEFFRSHRMPVADSKVPAAAQLSIKALLDFIMEERIREFSVTGYRWFDMRRLSVDPLFGPVQHQHYTYNANGLVQETFTLNDPKQFVFKIPAKILLENPKMQDNP
jgi:starch-binding outer membrane protein, SusD/RagB family